MSKRANFFAIGLFTLTALILGIFTVLLFGSSILAKRSTTVLVTFQGSVHGLRDGAKVKAYGVDIGTVRNILIHRIPETGDTVVPVLCDIKVDELSVLLGYDSVHAFDEDAERMGLRSNARAMLRAESLLTGLLYIELTENPTDENGFILSDERFAEYPSIPSVPTDMQVLLNSLQTIVASLESTDFQGLIEEGKATLAAYRNILAEVDFEAMALHLTTVLEEASDLVTRPELKTSLEDLSRLMARLDRFGAAVETDAAGVIEDLRSTLGQVGTVAAEAQLLLNPSGAFSSQLVQALEEITATSRSLRDLLEFIERNPNALITGRKQPE